MTSVFSSKCSRCCGCRFWFCGFLSPVFLIFYRIGIILSFWHQNTLGIDFMVLRFTSPTKKSWEVTPELDRFLVTMVFESNCVRCYDCHISFCSLLSLKLCTFASLHWSWTFFQFHFQFFNFIIFLISPRNPKEVSIFPDASVFQPKSKINRPDQVKSCENVTF